MTIDILYSFPNEILLDVFSYLKPYDIHRNFYMLIEYLKLLIKLIFDGRMDLKRLNLRNSTF